MKKIKTMTNLKEETINKLSEHNKTPEDVLWCGSEAFGWFTFDDFLELADKEYDSGYGGAEVLVDLLIVGKDFWLERNEYDGAEWWEYKTMPNKPEDYKKTNVLFECDYKDTLIEANKAHDSLE